MKQMTTNDPNVVKMWIETQSHHSAEWELNEKIGNATHMVLSNRFQKLRIEKATWDICFTKPTPNMYDTRMFRWDFDREWAEYLRLKG